VATVNWFCGYVCWYWYPAVVIAPAVIVPTGCV
jgi:hypothetical protein